MQTMTISPYILTIRDAIETHEADIECLDREIGDGDHYINMRRGCEAIAGMASELGTADMADALNKVGMKLLSTIGGASGPLFASFFMAMSKSLKTDTSGSTLSYALAFESGVQAIMHRGKAQAGEKTMLDVLIPVASTFKSLAEQGATTVDIANHLKQVAQTGLESTRNMLATKGRASGLGERVIGHLDAGAKSCQVMVEAACELVLKTE